MPWLRLWRLALRYVPVHGSESDQYAVYGLAEVCEADQGGLVQYLSSQYGQGWKGVDSVLKQRENTGGERE